MNFPANKVSLNTATCSSGVPNSSALGPVLFKWYVNDLPPVLKSNCSRFADDFKIQMEIRNDEDVNPSEFHGYTPFIIDSLAVPQEFERI